MSVVPILPAKAVPAENGWLTPDHVPGRVSVVVPTHNRARLLGVALDSVEGQTLGEGEIVVVDDGSTDDTLAVLEARAAPPAGWTRVVVSQANAGVSAARNAGARRCTGEFIVFLDSDDILHPPALELYRRTLRESGADYCYAPIEMTDGDGRPLPDGRAFFPDPASEGWEMRCFWLSNGGCYRRRILAAAGPWNEALTRQEDMEFLWRIKSLGGKAVFLPVVQGQYRHYGAGHARLSFDRRTLELQGWLGALDAFAAWAESTGRLDRARRLRIADFYRYTAVRLLIAGEGRASGRALDGMTRLCRGTGSPLGLVALALRVVKPGPVARLAQQAWGRARIRLGW